MRVRGFYVGKIPNFNLIKVSILKDVKKFFGLVLLRLLWEV